MELLNEFLAGMTAYQDHALFVMRLMVGGLFLYSGQRKIRNVKGFSEKNGLPVLLGLITILFELIGGAMLILGTYAQLGALMIILVMLGAMYFHIVKWKSPYWAQSKGWEYDLMWVVMCLVILTHGAGAYALLP